MSWGGGGAQRWNKMNQYNTMKFFVLYFWTIAIFQIGHKDIKSILNTKFVFYTKFQLILTCHMVGFRETDNYRHFKGCFLKPLDYFQRYLYDISKEYEISRWIRIWYWKTSLIWYFPKNSSRLIDFCGGVCEPTQVVWDAMKYSINSRTMNDFWTMRRLSKH